LTVNFFDDLRIGLATAEDIRPVVARRKVKKPETINYRTLKPEKGRASSARRSSARPGDWGVLLRQVTSGVRFQGHHLRAACGVEVTPRQGAARAGWGTIELARAGSRTSGTSRACPSRLGYLLDLAPKGPGEGHLLRPPT